MKVLVNVLSVLVILGGVVLATPVRTCQLYPCTPQLSQRLVPDDRSSTADWLSPRPGHRAGEPRANLRLSMARLLWRHNPYLLSEQALHPQPVPLGRGERLCDAPDILDRPKRMKNPRTSTSAASLRLCLFTAPVSRYGNCCCEEPSQVTTTLGLIHDLSGVVGSFGLVATASASVRSRNVVAERLLSVRRRRLTQACRYR